jgi:quinohemoprotein amine dehydrogenase
MSLLHCSVPWAVAALLGGGAVLAQDAEPGIPITNEAVKTACATCHQADDKGCLSRVSFRRTTPEGWQETVKRMATLNGAPLDPAQAREVVRYLANELGLAPEEARPAAFEVERRFVEYHYADRETDRVCSACHSVGRALLQRRTKGEWDLLVAMHRGYYPLADFQVFRGLRPPPTEPGPDGKPPDRRYPVDKALDHLKTAFPLQTPEWSAWAANRRPARLAGRWALSGYEPGRGPVFGEVKVTAQDRAPDEFTTETRYTYARSGAKVSRHGEGIVYTGFQWRGRSSSAASEEDSLREVMWVERDGKKLSGRWFKGAYDEIGLDVNLQRLAGDALVLGVVPSAVRAGARSVVRIYGEGFPPALGPADVDFGRGVRVASVTPAEGALRVEVEVAPDAPMGARDVFVGGTFAPRAAVVFNTVDALKVSPAAGLARIGGIQFPKRLQQFEATAFSNGPDGKPDTADDLDLGPVDVAWALEEFTAIFGDDDLRWTGRLDGGGLFTPAEDGPNPKRSGSRNNTGDLWVVATLGRDSPLQPKSSLRARAHLLVTVPLYVRWDQPEVMP